MPRAMTFILKVITFCKLGFLPQIQGGPQIKDEKEKSAGLLESAGNHNSW